MNKHRKIALQACVIAFGLAAAAPSWAQGAGTGGGAGTAGSGAGTTTTAPRAADTDDGMDWGWIGLLGLAGLAGLRRREPTTYDSRTTTTR